MPKVTQKTAGKIGLFSAIMLIFGSVVGIGIFFKNYGVFSANEGNWVGVLVSWIISIIMVLCIALSFGEVVTCKPKIQGEGLGGWATRYCGHYFGRFTKLYHTGVYYSVLTFAILFFAGEALLNCFSEVPGYVNFGKGTTLYVFIAGGGLFALFIILNYFASSAMTKFSNITGIIKFIPIAAVIILGIVFGSLASKYQGGLWNHHWLKFIMEDDGWKVIMTGSGPFNISSVIMCIPSILFAFEGYLVIGNVAGDMVNPKKNVSLSIILAMIIISALNLAITIGCMTIGTGNVYDLMYIIAGSDIGHILNIIVSILIFICIMGVLNAMVFSGMRAFQVICLDGTLFRGKQLANKHPNKLYGGAGYFSLMIMIWWLGIGIPSCILNTDAIADGASVILIVMIYLVYGTTLLGGFTNRFKKGDKHVDVVKIKIFPITAVIGILSCYFIFAYSGIYQSLVVPIMKPNDTDAAWGLFVKSPTGGPLPNIISEYGMVWRQWQTCIVFWVVAIAMIAIPFINDLLIRSRYKNPESGFIWQKPRIPDLEIEKKYEKKRVEILEKE